MADFERLRYPKPISRKIYSSAIQEKNTTFEIDSEAMVNPAQK